MLSKKQRPRKTLVSDAREVADRCTGLNIREAARGITRFLEASIQKSGMSFAQFGLMVQIAAAGDDTIGGLAQRTGLDQSTLSRNLRGLERAGMIEIAIVEKDLRRRAVWLTEKGARQLEAALTAWKEAHNRLSDIIDPADIRELAMIARRLGNDPVLAKPRSSVSSP